MGMRISEVLCLLFVTLWVVVGKVHQRDGRVCVSSLDEREGYLEGR